MLSDVVTLAALVQQAPALVLAALALLFAGWTFRQARRADAQLEARLAVSAVRQGKRLGRLEQTVGLLDMRRRITEEELAEDGIRLSFWPPDGPRLTARNDDEDQDQDVVPPSTDRHSFAPYSSPGPWAQDGVPLPDDDATAAHPAVPPIPPLPDFARHRR